MLYDINSVNNLHLQELQRESEHQRLVQVAVEAQQAAPQPVKLNRESVLNDMGRGLMALGLFSPSRERRTLRKV